MQKLLHRMRWAGDPAEEGRWILVVVEPNRRWMLAQLPRQRGSPCVPCPTRSSPPWPRGVGDFQAALGGPGRGAASRGDRRRRSRHMRREQAVMPVPGTVDTTSILGYAWPLVVSAGRRCAFTFPARRWSWRKRRWPACAAPTLTRMALG
ncbi:hypothetical protein ACFQU7_29460 [Pseudoroseomonas wenyumeiae]